YLTHPVEPTVLIATVRALLRTRKAELALLESNRQLEEALAQLKLTQDQMVQQERLRAMGQMASGIAHDFNNALMLIQGFSELALTRPELMKDEARVRQTMDSIHSSAKDAAEVVSRLNVFYRLSKQGDQPAPIDMAAVIEHTILLAAPKWEDEAQAAGKQITIERDLNPIPPVAGNEAELREALMNLIFNAVEAIADSGTITIRCRKAASEEMPTSEILLDAEKRAWLRAKADEPAGPQEHVMIQVSDTGSGMTKEARRACFDPFYSTKGLHGTGLGLAVVHGIITRNGGNIKVESIPGEGTTFTMFLPAWTGPAEEEASPEKAPAESAPSTPLNILIVDDRPAARLLLAAYLKSGQHHLMTAGSGVEALELFKARDFDVVVTDLAMPDMNGEMLAREVKQIRPDCPVVMVTGFGDQMQSAGEKSPHVDLLLCKPIREADLHAALAQVIGSDKHA
ncbi:MAG: response regulator, partial [Planctomycetota bacterium]|nr:response regulator [Planctomycetota bacterium]